jgi:hypothetical protein
MARRNKERRAAKRAEKRQNKIDSRTADVMGKELMDVQKAEKKRKKKEPKEVIDPQTGLNLSSPDPDSTIQKVKTKKKKKKVTTVTSPVQAGSIDIPQTSTTRELNYRKDPALKVNKMDKEGTLTDVVANTGRVTSRKIGDPTANALSPTPMPTQSAIDASNELRKSELNIGDEIRKEAESKVDEGKATQGQFNQALEDASKAEEEVKKEKQKISTPIPGDGSTLSGAMMAGGAPPVSFSGIGQKADVEKEVVNQAKANAEQNPSAPAANTAANLGAIEKLGIQDYYPTASRNIAVGTFTGEVIGSQTIYSGAGGLAPMGLYDARKRALAKAATAKQAAIDKFLTLEDTAKAYNMEYKDYAYDHLYDILEKHGFSVTSVMRDRDAAKEVYRLKSLGKELKFVEEESKSVLEQLGKEGAYVPPSIAKAAKNMFYGMQDKDKVFSGKSDLVKTISELKAYNSLTKKAEDLATEFSTKLSEMQMNEGAMANYAATGEVKGNEEFEKGKRSFVSKIQSGKLARGTDGYYTGMLKYFGGNVDELFSSYVDAANYSEDQLEASKKIFVNLMPESVEMTFNSYKDDSFKYYQLRENINLKKAEMIAAQQNTINLETQALSGAVGTIESGVAARLAETGGKYNPSDVNDRNFASYLIRSALNKSQSSGLFKWADEIPGKVGTDAYYSSQPIFVETKNAIKEDFANMTTTAYIKSGETYTPRAITLMELVNDAGRNFMLPAGKDKNNEMTYMKVGDKDLGRFNSLITGGKEASGGFVPTSSNTSLAYTDEYYGTMNKLTNKNLIQYAESPNKSQVRFFSGNLVVGTVEQEKRESVSAGTREVIKGATTLVDVERTYTLPGNWSGAERKASIGIDNADNKILFGDPTQKTRSSKFEGFNFGNSSNQQ